MPYSVRSWGPWRLDPVNNVLVAPNGYDVNLERCRTPAQVLDWIAQVSHKQWAIPDVLAGLVHALDDVLHIEANLCPNEQPRELTEKRLAELLARAYKTAPLVDEASNRGPV